MPEQDLLIRVAQGVKAEDAVRAIDTIEFARTLEHSSLVRPGSLAKVVLISSVIQSPSSGAQSAWVCASQCATGRQDPCNERSSLSHSLYLSLLSATPTLSCNT